MSQSFDSRIYARQGRLIEELRQQLDASHKQISCLNEKVASLDTAGNFYLSIQQLILAEPTLMEEWQTFVALAALYRPDLKVFSGA